MISTSSFIVLTRGLITLVDDEDFGFLNQWKWHCNNYGYAIRSRWNQKKILMHRIIMNTPDDMEVDHINNNRLDNRKCNLRNCIHAENLYNKKLNKNNTSGYKGVSFNKRDKKWNTYIMIHKKKIDLGNFNTPWEAACIYNDAAKRLFGEFAFINIKEEI